MAFDRNGLHFREVEPQDLDMLREWRNDPKMSAGWRDPRSVQTTLQQGKWYQQLNGVNQAFIMMDGTLTVGLLRFKLDYDMNEAKVTGTDIAPDCHGKGYGKRMLKSAAQYLMDDLGFHRVTGECLATNEGARKMILGAGFKQEGTFRAYVWRDGKWVDWYLFSALRGEL